MLKIKDLNKKFNQVHAVNNLNIKVNNGEIYGLLGTNGAGKTTTFRMILNLFEPTSGDIYWDNQKIDDNFNDLVGYLPEERSLLTKLTVLEQVKYFGMLKGMKTIDIIKQLDYWLERFNIIDYKRKKIKELSKGNQQKIQFIVAVLHNPKILILDEPFTGLDPINLEQLKDAIMFLKEKGTSIIFSSHRMEHIESLCDSVTILAKGKTVLSGNISEIKASYPIRYVTIKGNVTVEDLETLSHVTKVIPCDDEFNVYVSSLEEVYQLLDGLNQSHQITKFMIHEPTLHDIFIEKVGTTYES